MEGPDSVQEFTTPLLNFIPHMVDFEQNFSNFIEENKFILDNNQLKLNLILLGAIVGLCSGNFPSRGNFDQCYIAVQSGKIIQALVQLSENGQTPRLKINHFDLEHKKSGKIDFYKSLIDVDETLEDELALAKIDIAEIVVSQTSDPYVFSGHTLTRRSADQHGDRVDFIKIHSNLQIDDYLGSVSSKNLPHVAESMRKLFTTMNELFNLMNFRNIENSDISVDLLSFEYGFLYFNYKNRYSLDMWAYLYEDEMNSFVILHKRDNEILSINSAVPIVAKLPLAELPFYTKIFSVKNQRKIAAKSGVMVTQRVDSMEYQSQSFETFVYQFPVRFDSLPESIYHLMIFPESRHADIRLLESAKNINDVLENDWFGSNSVLAYLFGQSYGQKKYKKRIFERSCSVDQNYQVITYLFVHTLAKTKILAVLNVRYAETVDSVPNLSIPPRLNFTKGYVIDVIVKSTGRKSTKLLIESVNYDSISESTLISNWTYNFQLFTGDAQEILENFRQKDTAFVQKNLCDTIGMYQKFSPLENSMDIMAALSGLFQTQVQVFPEVNSAFILKSSLEETIFLEIKTSSYETVSIWERLKENEQNRTRIFNIEMLENAQCKVKEMNSPEIKHEVIVGECKVSVTDNDETFCKVIKDDEYTDFPTEEELVGINETKTENVTLFGVCQINLDQTDIVQRNLPQNLQTKAQKIINIYNFMQQLTKVNKPDVSVCAKYSVEPKYSNRNPQQGHFSAMLYEKDRSTTFVLPHTLEMYETLRIIDDYGEQTEIDALKIANPLERLLSYFSHLEKVTKNIDTFSKNVQDSLRIFGQFYTLDKTFRNTTLHQQQKTTETSSPKLSRQEIEQFDVISNDVTPKSIDEIFITNLTNFMRKFHTIRWFVTRNHHLQPFCQPREISRVVPGLRNPMRVYTQNCSYLLAPSENNFVDFSSLKVKPPEKAPKLEMQCFEPEPSQENPVVSATRNIACKNTTVISKLTSGALVTVVNAGGGDDEIFGTQNFTNTIFMKSGDKNITGGKMNDSFHIYGENPASGTLEGLDGQNELHLEDYMPGFKIQLTGTSKTYQLFLKSPNMLSAKIPETLTLGNITKVSGRNKLSENIRLNCQTDFLDLKAGKNDFNMDEVEIFPDNCQSHPKEIIIRDYTFLKNRAKQGKFLYIVRLETGESVTTLESDKTGNLEHVFLFENITLQQVRSILWQNILYGRQQTVHFMLETSDNHVSKLQITSNQWQNTIFQFKDETLMKFHGASNAILCVVKNQENFDRTVSAVTKLAYNSKLNFSVVTRNHEKTGIKLTDNQKVPNLQHRQLFEDRYLASDIANFSCRFFDKFDTCQVFFKQISYSSKVDGEHEKPETMNIKIEAQFSGNLFTEFHTLSGESSKLVHDSEELLTISQKKLCSYDREESLATLVFGQRFFENERPEIKTAKHAILVVSGDVQLGNATIFIDKLVKEVVYVKFAKNLLMMVQVHEEGFDNELAVIFEQFFENSETNKKNITITTTEENCATCQYPTKIFDLTEFTYDN